MKVRLTALLYCSIFVLSGSNSAFAGAIHDIKNSIIAKIIEFRQSDREKATTTLQPLSCRNLEKSIRMNPSAGGNSSCDQEDCLNRVREVLARATMQETQAQAAIREKRVYEIEERSREKRSVGLSEILARTQMFKLRPGFRDCGLTDAEITTLIGFTAVDYEWINPALWTHDEKVLSENEAYFETLRLALNKLSPYRGMVKRITRLPDAVLEEHQIGNTVTYSGFTSTFIGENHTGLTGKQTFTIHSRSGRYIAPLSDNAYEEEVLFLPGTKFKIIGRYEDDGRSYIEMEELGD